MLLDAPYIPKVKYNIFLIKFYRNAIDTSNFSQYPDSDNETIPVASDKDPFLDI